MTRTDIPEHVHAIETSGRCWAIIPEMLQSLHSMGRSVDMASLERWLTERIERVNIAGDAASDSGLLSARGRGRPPNISGAVATIPLQGVLMPQMSLLAQLFGLGSGLNVFRAQLREVANDKDIGAIVLDIDSPGGLVDQIPETAAEIRSAREQKPVVAVANTLAASAAYWLASQAEEIVVTPSGEIGSIGVYAEHHDISRSLESQGVQPTLISAGKYKTEGNPYEPLDDEGRKAMQQSVNDFYTLFVRDVAHGRDASTTEVREGYGEGRVLTAKRAVEANLADRVATFGDVVGGLQKRSTKPSLLEAAEAPGIAYSAEDRVRIFQSIEAVATAARKEVVN